MTFVAQSLLIDQCTAICKQHSDECLTSSKADPSIFCSSGLTDGNSLA
jgi:hypothetical protein